MSLQAPQITTTLTHDDLEALIRRVIREELQRILPTVVSATSTQNGDGKAELIEKDGFLVVKTGWEGDIVDLVQQDREARLETLMQRMET